MLVWLWFYHLISIVVRNTLRTHNLPTWEADAFKYIQEYYLFLEKNRCNLMLGWLCSVVGWFCIRIIHFSFLMISQIICSLGEEDFSSLFSFIIYYVACLQNIPFSRKYFQYFLNLWKDLINLIFIFLHFHKEARFSSQHGSLTKWENKTRLER